MARAHLRAVLTNLTGNVAASQSINVYRPGTTTAPIGTMYSAASAGSTVVNPRTTNSLGEVEVWLEFPQLVDFAWTDSSGTHRVAGRSEGIAGFNTELQHVSPSGDDDNDGLSWETPKETILAAVDALPSGGKIYIAQNSYVGGEVANQGIWLVGANDGVNYADPLPGWRYERNLDFIGIGGPNSGLFGRAGVRIYGGQPGGTNWDKEDPDKPAIWLAGVTRPVSFNRIYIEDAPQCLRMGISSDNGNRGCNSAHATFIECGFDNGLADEVERTNKAACVEIGYQYWTYFDHCVFFNQRAGRESDSDFESDTSAAVLVKPGAGQTTLVGDIGTTETTLTVDDGSEFATESIYLRVDGLDPDGGNHSEIMYAATRVGNVFSGIVRGFAFSALEPHFDGNTVSATEQLSAGLLHFDHIISAGGGLKYYRAPTAWSVYVNDWLQEGLTSVGPTVWLANVDQYGSATLNDVQMADALNNVEPTIRIEGNAPPGVVRIGTVYPDWIEGQYFRDLPFASYAPPKNALALNGGFGFVETRLVARHDGAVRKGGISAVPFVNLAAQDVTTWTGLEGTATVTTGQRDVYGGTNAAKLSMVGSDPDVIENDNCRPFRGAVVLSEGDWIMGGAWVKPDTATYMQDVKDVALTVVNAFFTDFAANVETAAIAYEGQWQFRAGWGQIIDVQPDPTEILISLNIDENNARYFCYPVLCHIPANTLADGEIAEMGLHLWTWAEGAAAGQVALLPKQSLYIPSGFIEGVEIAAPATPAANKFRLYAKDNGAGKTQLMVMFADGSEQQIKIQP